MIALEESRNIQMLIADYSWDQKGNDRDNIENETRFDLYNQLKQKWKIHEMAQEKEIT